MSGQEFLEEHSGWASAVRYGSLALKGPAGAVATYGIDQGIGFIAQQSGAAELLNNLAGYIGSYGFELLRDGDITSLLKDKTERFEIDPGKQTFGANLTNGAATLLGMTVPVIKGVNGSPHGTVKLEGSDGGFHVDESTSGPYNSKEWRDALEERYGAENVNSTTTPSSPHQRVNSDPPQGA